MMGISLRTCKEKIYSWVHDGLKTWVAAAADDGWAVNDVRFGPKLEDRRGGAVNGGGGSRTPSPVKKKLNNEEGPPRLELPKLDLGGETRNENGGG